MAVFYGADVSYAQGTVTWATYAANKSFVWIKAAGADAGLYTDSHFATNQSGARGQAGLRVGYYFFGDSTVDPTSAASYFASAVGSLNHGERLALDIEGAHAPGDNWAYTFSSYLKNYYGFNPSCYMSQFHTSTDLDWPLTTTITHLWMANWSLASTDFSETGGVAEWGAGHSNYDTLQYADNGTIPGISGLVDLDSFNASNSGTMTDWDALGYGGASAPGSLTAATVTNPTMTYTQPIQQSVNTKYTYDQVLFSDIFTASVSASSWPQTINGPATGLNQFAYAIGNYDSVVNGSDIGTNDFGFITAGDYGQYPGDLPSVVVQPIVDSLGNLTFAVTYNPPNPSASTSATINLTINIALLAYPNATNLTGTSVKQIVGYANAIANVGPGPYSAYRRIAPGLDSSVGTGLTTIGHGLGNIPNLLYWVQDNSGTIEMQPAAWSDGGFVSNHFGLSMDSTNIYIYVDSANNTKGWYRIYLDN